MAIWSDDDDDYDDDDDDDDDDDNNNNNLTSSSPRLVSIWRLHSVMSCLRWETLSSSSDIPLRKGRDKSVSKTTLYYP